MTHPRQPPAYITFAQLPLEHFRFISTTLSLSFSLSLCKIIKPPVRKEPPPATDMQSSSVISVSPSFTSHSSNNLADIAARVVQEFRDENGHDDDDDIFNFTDDGNRFSVPADNQGDCTGTEKLKENEEDSDEDREFEFAVVCAQSDSSPVSADEIFSNGEILPRYPLFDRSLLLDVVPDFKKVADSSETDSKPSPVVRLPLRKLFSEERDSASCSSSEADDLDGITPGTYCIWKPKAESPGRCKKSNSTGNTSKRWKFRDLVHRSNSDCNIAAGKDTSFVLFTLTASKKRNEKAKKVEKTAKVAVAVGDGDGEAAAAVPDENNPANKIKHGGNRRRSYLPYKQDLVGVFANVNGLSRNLHPF